MRKGILILFIMCLICTAAFADQLAYLSKADAERGAEFIEKAKKIIFFCGCCDKAEIEKIKVKGVEVRFTGIEQFYEIYVFYQYQKEIKSVPVDLAYVWIEINGTIQTVGKMLGLEHDPCKTPSW